MLKIHPLAVQDGAAATTMAPGSSREIEFNITHVNPNLRGSSTNEVSRYRDVLTWIPTEPPMWGGYDSTSTTEEHTLQVTSRRPRKAATTLND